MLPAHPYQDLGIDVGYSLYHWDANSALRGYRFYSTAAGVLFFLAGVGGTVGTILSGIAATETAADQCECSNSGDEDNSGGSWSMAATIFGTVTLALGAAAVHSQKAADARKKQLNKLMRQSEQVTEDDEAV